MAIRLPGRRSCRVRPFSLAVAFGNRGLFMEAVEPLASNCSGPRWRSSPTRRAFHVSVRALTPPHCSRGATSKRCQRARHGVRTSDIPIAIDEGGNQNRATDAASPRWFYGEPDALRKGAGRWSRRSMGSWEIGARCQSQAYRLASKRCRQASSGATLASRDSNRVRSCGRNLEEILASNVSMEAW